MTISTYTELQTTVIEWANRGDAKYQARVPDFIRLGEGRIFRRLRVSAMIKAVNLASVIGTREVALPADWAEFRDVRGYDGAPLSVATADEIYSLGQRSDDSIFAIEGGKLILGDMPSTVYNLPVRYYAKPDPLATTPTNWLLSSAPAAYLYAALIEGAMYVKNPDDAGRWGTLLDRVIGELQDEDRRARSSGGPLRVRPR
ncbi:MAG: hypothetical protein DI563_01930 [Variovorax paradoxus]|uniref:Uncharacterized protein n=1 Tax=Variovorax paradoxus TaxID=34073 RepID=A0A2W5QHC6_VARPD|nr:MAG: hypothetical protein DI563_01930 [Variovorax paradoxus]